MKKILLIIVLALLSSTSIAAEKDYKVCSASGFLLAQGDRFEASLASDIVHKRFGRDDPICQAAHRDAYKATRDQLINHILRENQRMQFSFLRIILSTSFLVVAVTA
jgi:hypothetical protein